MLTNIAVVQHFDIVLDHGIWSYFHTISQAGAGRYDSRWVDSALLAEARMLKRSEKFFCAERYISAEKGQPGVPRGHQRFAFGLGGQFRGSQDRCDMIVAQSGLKVLESLAIDQGSGATSIRFVQVREGAIVEDLGRFKKIRQHVSQRGRRNRRHQVCSSKMENCPVWLFSSTRRPIYSPTIPSASSTLPDRKEIRTARDDHPVGASW
ncbi:hypothetical protein ABW34_01140 [Achromobacter xylosoxidans]|nr:hypothetical protein ABW34_01140 [Achromobacter xylosoxidans]KOQ47161.1 hypothetical protein ABW37_00310 [Achromobacter xylosoxidans]KOQ59729.1 hypothetical protein ABW40_06070 [Achromobacter xylosoxidans]